MCEETLIGAAERCGAAWGAGISAIFLAAAMAHVAVLTATQAGTLSFCAANSRYLGCFNERLDGRLKNVAQPPFVLDEEVARIHVAVCSTTMYWLHLRP